MELVKVYKRKSDGLLFVQFGEEKILWCNDDDTGESDLHNVSQETINNEFEFIEQYEEN